MGGLSFSVESCTSVSSLPVEEQKVISIFFTAASVKNSLWRSWKEQYLNKLHWTRQSQFVLTDYLIIHEFQHRITTSCFAAQQRPFTLNCDRQWRRYVLVYITRATEGHKTTILSFFHNELEKGCRFHPRSEWLKPRVILFVHSYSITVQVIGGGAVGLAIARQLASRSGTSTLLLERNGRVGEETSSRNSEVGSHLIQAFIYFIFFISHPNPNKFPQVIHAGLYYGPDSLKTALCIRGRHLLYDLCNRYNIPHRNTGKWIVAQTPEQWEELVKVHKFSQSISDVPTHFVSLEEGAKLEPFVRAKVGILNSPTTGIVDSHAYMQFLLGDFESKGGDLAVNRWVIWPRRNQISF